MCHEGREGSLIEGDLREPSEDWANLHRRIEDYDPGAERPDDGPGRPILKGSSVWGNVPLRRYVLIMESPTNILEYPIVGEGQYYTRKNI